MKSNQLQNCFLIFSAIYVFTVAMGSEDLAAFVKPFLLLPLIAIVTFTTNYKEKKTLLLALFFSWVGDIVLIFAYKGELYFIGGLVAFLISHIFYIVLFYKLGVKFSSAKKYPIIGIIIVVFLYLSIILATLLPSLGLLKIPVIVYAIVLATMLMVAAIGSLSWKSNSKYYIVFGAIFFVCSDTFLAFNKFYMPIKFAGLYIMITYIIAQYCITTGAIKLTKNLSNI